MTRQQRQASPRSYREGWKRSAAFWREQNARDAAREAERNAREREINHSTRKERVK